MDFQSQNWVVLCLQAFFDLSVHQFISRYIFC